LLFRFKSLNCMASLINEVMDPLWIPRKSDCVDKIVTSYSIQGG